MGGVVKCKKTCKFCGKEFIGLASSRFCCDECKRQSKLTGKCEVCGKPIEAGRRFCSIGCSAEFNRSRPEEEKHEILDKIRKTKEDRYGDPNYRNSEKAKQTSLQRYGATTYVHSAEGKKVFRQTMMERYGVANALENPEFLEKMEATVRETGISYRFHTPEWDEAMLKKYGTTVPYKNEELKSKGIQTLIDHYGVTSPAKLDFVKEKSKQTCLKKYGVEYSFQSPEVREKAKQTLLDRYGVENALSLCKVSSKLNREIGELLGVTEYEFSIHAKRYDLKLGDTLIEVNPTISHNSDHDYCFGVRSKTYHIDKAKLAKDNGFSCFNIWDWDDLEKIKLHFQPKKRIYARKCEAIFIDKATSDAFLDSYHLQSSCSGDFARVGLEYDGELIGVMTFGSPRYNDRYQAELLRLAFRPDMQSIGGASKMFKLFIDCYKPDSIVSYCDNSKFSGGIYGVLGFELEDKGVPTAHWFNMRTKKHYTDALLRQRGADALLGTDYGKGSDNEKIMLDHGFVRVYDCGQSRYAWKAEGGNKCL